MDTLFDNVFSPSSFSELFTIWNRFPLAIPYAGGTNMNLNQSLKEKFPLLPENQENNIPKKPPVFLSLDKIEELHRITRTEQYLDIGAMVNLNSLLRLGKIVPHVIRGCLENIAGVQVRNIATVGGNVCSVKKGDDPNSKRLFDLPVPLTALDAQYELRTAQTSRWVSAARFHSITEKTGINSQELLTRIRLPLYQWDYSVYKKFCGEGFFSGETLVFLAKTQKNILSEIRILYKGGSIIRNKDSESILNGKYLPLNRKTADEFVESWKEFLTHKREETDFLKNALLYTIGENVKNLSE